MVIRKWLKIPTKKQQIISKKVPTGVKIISIYHYVESAILILFAISFYFKLEALTGLSGASIFSLEFIFSLGLLDSELINIAKAIFLFIVISVFLFFVGRGLWKGKKWARNAAIVMSVLGIFLGLKSLINGNFLILITLVINGVIGAYLIFSNEVKSAFS